MTPGASSFRRLLGALPDVITGAACLIVWVSPFAFGEGSVKTVVLTMLLEFLLVHGTGFFTAFAGMDDVKPSRRILAMLGLSAFYSLFLIAICLGFGEWWPMLLFAWLLIGKIVWVRANPKPQQGDMMRQMGTWAFSVVAYLGAVLGGVLLPLPYLGLTPDVVAQLALPGGGEWIERPHTAVAGMAFYFFALAAFKWIIGGRQSA